MDSCTIQFHFIQCINECLCTTAAHACKCYSLLINITTLFHLLISEAAADFHTCVANTALPAPHALWLESLPVVSCYILLCVINALWLESLPVGCCYILLCVINALWLESLPVGCCYILLCVINALWLESLPVVCCHILLCGIM